MANVMHKFMEFIGVEENDADVEQEMLDDEELYETPRHAEKRKERVKATAPVNSNVVSLPQTTQTKMIVYRPVSYEDTQNIIDNLKSRKPIIVNMENIDVEVAQRILDFMSGACYAINGTVYKVSSRIFAVVPTNYDIIGNSDGTRD